MKAETALEADAEEGGFDAGGREGDVRVGFKPRSGSDLRSGDEACGFAMR